QLLNELGATDDQNTLTTIGRELATLPLDPRVGRMILAAREREALREGLVIASGLSVQDVRDRPIEQQQAADQAQRKFDDEKSEFSGDLKLWNWLETSRGGNGEHRLSSRKHEQILRENFISPRRVREWRDVHSQLQTVVAEHGWRINTSPATYEQLHLSMLAGLLGNVGVKNDEDESYLGARGIRFHRHPGAHLAKKPGRWIVAAELVETTRLFARGIANIDVRWIEQVGGHLLKKQLLDPHWEKKAGQVVALERATLYGLVVYMNRRVDFGIVDAALIFAFFDKQVPADVHSTQGFERWYRAESKRQPELLLLTREELMRHEAAGITTSAFPRTIRLGGVDCAATYLHEPGAARDGVTVALPIYALNAANEARCEWLVPGMLRDKVVALAKTLPQRPRSRLVPLPAYAEAFIARHPFGEGSLIDTLVADVTRLIGIDVKR